LSTLYIRHPAKTAAEQMPPGTTLACPFALVADNGNLLQQGAAPLPSLGATVAQAKRVVLLLAASDVTLLRVKVPPLSPARLKAALPSLVEDQLIADPSESAMVAAPQSDGLHTVAVVQRRWLEQLAATLAALGARKLTALPAQLCLPYWEGTVAAAATYSATGQDGGIELTLRLSPQEGMGLPIQTVQPQTAAAEVIQALRLVVPSLPVTLYVPAAEIAAYQEAADADMEVQPDHWQHWIEGTRPLALDLMPAIGGGSASNIDWRRWRWPLALAAMLAAANIAGLNIDWWRLKREAETLRSSMMQTFKSAYPNETVIIDPTAQMRQKIAAAKHDAGQAAPDDFTALAAAFGAAWSGAGKTPGAIAALEYRDRSLFVKLNANTELPAAQLKSALATQNLTLAEAPGGQLQIRSGK
jgi:general secretion pathway protein L